MRSHTLPQLLLYLNNVCPDDYDDDDDDDEDDDDDINDKMKMMMATTKIVMIAKLDTVRRFKVVQCPLQPDKDSKLRSNKDDCDDDDDDGGGHVDEGGDNVGGDVDDDHRKCIQYVVPVTYSKSSKVSPATHLHLIINSPPCEGSQMDAAIIKGEI